MAATALVFAAANYAEAREGFYVGLGTSYETIGGEFDGSVGVLEGFRVLHLPEIDNAFGVDLRAGYRTPEAWAVELELMRTVHKGTWIGQQEDVMHDSFSINAKYSFREKAVVQPFLLLGFSLNRLVVERGAADVFTGATGDARLTGPGLNLGFGADTYLGRHVSLGLGFTYRHVEYAERQNNDQKKKINNRLNGSGFGIGLNVAYHF